MPHPRTTRFTFALTAALCGTTTHAALVQITQSGNRATPFADNIDADLTGDGIAEVSATVDTFYFLPGDPIRFEVQMTIEGLAYAAAGGEFFDANGVAAAGGAAITAPLGTGVELSYYFPIVFSDAAYGLTGEDGWVEVFLRADDTEPEDSGIEFRRLVFDPDARGTPGFDQNVSYPEAVVPEPVTGIALASVVGCVLRRRR